MEINWIFLSRHRSLLATRVGIIIYLISVMGSKLYFFSRAESKLTRFSVGIELDLFFVRGHNRLRFCVQVEKLLGFNLWVDISLVFSGGSKMTWFLCAGTKRLAFSVGIGWLPFRADGRNWLVYCMLAEYHLVLGWASNSTSFSCGWSELTWFQWRDRNWIVFCVGFENDFVMVFGSKLSMGIEMYLDFVWG